MACICTSQFHFIKEISKDSALPKPLTSDCMFAFFLYIYYRLANNDHGFNFTIYRVLENFFPLSVIWTVNHQEFVSQD